MLPPPSKRRTPEGGGPLGFGCGFLLIFAIAFQWLDVHGFDVFKRNGFLIVLAIAVVGGFLAARLGDSFFDRWL